MKQYVNFTILDKSKYLIFILTIILSLGVSLAGAYFVYNYQDSRENELATGLISIDFKDSSDSVNLVNSYPVIDDVGLTNKPYTFTIKNTSKVPINANIMLDVDESTTINLGAVRYALYIDDELVKKDYVKDDLILYTYDNLAKDEELNCKLVFWIDYYYEKAGETCQFKIKVVGESFYVIANNK